MDYWGGGLKLVLRLANLALRLCRGSKHLAVCSMRMSVLICFRYDVDYYITDGDYNFTMGLNYPEQRRQFEQCEEIVKNESLTIQGRLRSKSRVHICICM